MRKSYQQENRQIRAEIEFNRQAREKTGYRLWIDDLISDKIKKKYVSKNYKPSKV